MKLDSDYYRNQSIHDLRDIFANINDYEHTERALIVLNEIAYKLEVETSKLTIKDILGYIPKYIDHEYSISKIINGQPIAGLISFIKNEGIFSDSQITENETIWRFMRLMELTTEQNAV